MNIDTDTDVGIGIDIKQVFTFGPMVFQTLYAFLYSTVPAHLENIYFLLCHLFPLMTPLIAALVGP